jgi:hypothetical protein
MLIVCTGCMSWIVANGLGFILHRAEPMRFYCVSCESPAIVFAPKCLKTLSYGDAILPCQTCGERKVFTPKEIR